MTVSVKGKQCNCLIWILYLCTAIKVNFNQPVYIVDENSGLIQIQLTFSNPSSINITLDVSSEDINATGEFAVNTDI